MIALRQGPLQSFALFFGMLVGLSCGQGGASTFTVRLRPGPPVTDSDHYVYALMPDEAHPKEGGIEFLKEPDFGTHQIVRGVLLTDRATSRVVGYALDFTDRKLYVDDNANRYLTDDRDSAYQGKQRPQYGGQYWVAEHVPIRYGNPPRTYCVNYHFSTEEGESSEPAGAVVSTWRGDVELGGKGFTIVAVPGVSQSLDYSGNWFILRRGEEFSTPTLCRRSRGFGPSDRLFIAGHAYDMSFRYVPAGDNCDIEATFVETSMTLGRIRLVGEGIRALTMTRGQRGPRMPVYVDPAEGVIDVPAGGYSSISTDLEIRPGEIRSFDWHLDDVVVSPAGETVLHVGGPLNQAILPRRDGPFLRVVHRMANPGGTEAEKSYTLSELPDCEPELRILRSGQLLTTTSMSYG